MSRDIAALLARCRAAGLTLLAEGDALHVDYERDPPLGLIEELRRHKHELMAALSGPVPSAAREWISGLDRLHPDRPPGDVPQLRWRQFISDARRLIDDGWAEKAAEFGWTAIDLFGSDDTRPFARVDQMGLAWVLNGDKLIALSENAAAIEGRSGARQTYRRKVATAGRVLAWELCNGRVPEWPLR